MKKLFSFMLLTLMFSACSSENENAGNEAGEVLMQVSIADWELPPTAGNVVNMTRAEASEVLYPINVMLVPEGADKAIKTVTLTEENEFSLSLREGSYDIFAICGLPTDKIPQKLSDAVAIPDGENGKTDFAAGRMSFRVANGKCSPEMTTIKAARQMSWLDVKFVDVPESIDEINLYVKGLTDEYRLSNIATDGTSPTGWALTEYGSKRYTQIKLSRDGANFVGGGIVAPSDGETGMTFAVEATTTNKNKKLLAYNSQTSRNAGTHLSLTFSYDWLDEIGGGLSLDTWQTKDETLTEGSEVGFTVGQQYFSQAATVVNVSATGTSLNILAHKPMWVTLDEVKEWDCKHVPYTLSPEISVQRWAFPTSDASVRNIFYAIEQIGWDAFDAQFRAGGLDPIDRALKNILAYRDKTTGTFYVYDFANGECQDIVNEDGDFLFYPLGIIQMGK